MAEPPPPPKMVGRGLDAPKRSPKDPQAWLHTSCHPYSPFTGNPLKWNSWMYDDGSTYEGLTRDDAPHMKGVMIFGNGHGGGMEKAKKGDKYEGEFQMGFSQGLGQYTGMNGEVYRGEWLFGKRHGCGALIDQSPFMKKMEKGMDPDKAWRESREEVEKRTRYGTWQADMFLHGPDSSGEFCHMMEIKGVLQELDSVVTRARMFQFKPDGDVTYTKAQDAVGIPAPVMQDPVHYPHGTKFMAPGPMGQCFPLPDDEDLVQSMQVHARNHQRIFNSYNFDVAPAPGSDMDKAHKLHRKREAKKAAKIKRARELEERRNRRLDQRARQRQQEGGVDQQASVPEGVPSTDGRSSPHPQPPTVFASISLGLGRALQGANSVLDSWAHQSRRNFRPLLPPRQ